MWARNYVGRNIWGSASQKTGQLKLPLIYQISIGAMDINIQYTCEIDQTMNIL